MDGTATNLAGNPPRRLTTLKIKMTVASVVLISLGALLLVNASDEPLNPRVSAVLDANHDTISAEDNLFFAILGMSPQSGKDIGFKGREIYAEYLKTRASDPYGTYPLAGSDPGRDPIVGDRTLLCGSLKEQESCIERARVRPQDLQTMLTRNQALLNQYKIAQSYPHLQDPIAHRLQSPDVPWRAFMSGKCLWLTAVALQINDGQTDAAIESLRGELAFTRRMLAEPDISLTDKLVLAISTRRSLGVISELLRIQPLTDTQYQKLAATVTPLSDAERSSETASAREFAFYASALETIALPKNPKTAIYKDGDANFLHGLVGELAPHFLNYNASLNFAWSFLESKLIASRAPCVDLASNARKRESMTLPLTEYLYNPAGKYFGLLRARTEDSGATMMCDLEGMQRIVSLQAAIHLKHLPNDAIADFVTHAGPQYEDPYTDRPLHWDATNRSLYFQPQEERDRYFLPWSI